MPAARVHDATSQQLLDHTAGCETEHGRNSSALAHFSLSIVRGRTARPDRPARELPPLVTVSDVSEFASLLGNPARASMIMALMDSDYCTARQLSEIAGVTAQTASGHIAKLLQGGIIARVKVGRELRHRLRSSEVEGIIRLLYLGGASLNERGSRQVGANLRIARGCRGHIAGQLGIELARCLADVGSNGSCRLHSVGRKRLLHWGLGQEILDLEGADCPMCEDWSERGAHIGGSLGRAIYARCKELGWLKPDSASRALVLTTAGLNGFRMRFDIDIA